MTQTGHRLCIAAFSSDPDREFSRRNHWTLDFAFEGARALKVSRPYAPLLVAGRVDRHRSPLNNGPKVAVAIIALKSECGRGVNRSGVKNDGEGAKRKHSDTLVVEAGLQL